MSLSLHNLTPAKNSQKKSKLIGRGGKRGTTSGRGTKGQRSRSGGRRGLKRLGMRQLIERTHKLHGFKSRQPKPAIVSLADLQKHYLDNELVNAKSLVKKGLIKNNRAGVKILSNGRIKVKLNVAGCALSKSAREAILKAGGKIQN